MEGHLQTALWLKNSSALSHQAQAISKWQPVQHIFLTSPESYMQCVCIYTCTCMSPLCECEGCSQSTVSYFMMFAHNSRDGDWWDGKEAETSCRYPLHVVAV